MALDQMQIAWLCKDHTKAEMAKIIVAGRATIAQREDALATAVAAQAELVEALKSIRWLRPAGDVNKCQNSRKLVEEMENIASSAIERARMERGL